MNEYVIIIWSVAMVLWCIDAFLRIGCVFSLAQILLILGFAIAQILLIAALLAEYDEEYKQ